MSYYTDKKEEILQYINGNNIKEASALIDEELALPYLPVDFLNWLQEMKSDLSSEEDGEQKLYSSRELHLLLQRSYEAQRAAVYHLAQMNLRAHTDICREFLLSNGGADEVKRLLVTELIKQEIGVEMKALLGGAEYVFIPKYLQYPEASGGYLQAKRQLGEIFLRNPSLLRLAEDLLYQKCFEKLPLTFTEEEADFLLQEVQAVLHNSFKEL